jgi:hypothetical protein
MSHLISSDSCGTTQNVFAVKQIDFRKVEFRQVYFRQVDWTLPERTPLGFCDAANICNQEATGPLPAGRDEVAVTCKTA